MIKDTWVEPNIGPIELRKRLVSGFVLLAVTIALLSGLLLSTHLRWLRLVMLPLYFISAVCFFQMREKTCVVLAKKGQCKFSRDAVDVTDPLKLAKIREQSKRVYWYAGMAALLMTLITVIL